VAYANGVVTVTASPGTVVNGKASDTFIVGTNAIVVLTDMNGGIDTVTLTGINGSFMRFNMGTEDDVLRFTLCVAGTLLVDGGAGIDSYQSITSRFTGTKSITNVEIIVP